MSLDVEECLRRIGRLPHAAVIERDDALRWVRLTLGIEPERVGWHIARAGGIGGSEAGTLVAWRFGGFHTRGDAHRMAKQKLLKLPPDRRNDDTGRGAFLEDHIASVFEHGLTRRGLDWRARDDLKAAIEAGPHPDFPWLRASVDKVYEIGGRNVIVDFKAPSEESLQEYVRHGSYQDYAAQLNHYCLVGEGRGVRVDGLLLAMYDYRRVSSVGCHEFEIGIDRDLQQRIVAASAEFWNGYVMEGALPAADEDRVLQADGGVPPEVDDAARRAVVTKIIADKATKDYAAAQEEIAHWVRRTGTLGDGVLPLGSFAEGSPGFLQVRATAVLDAEAAVQRLRDLGVAEAEIEGLREPDKYDGKKLPAAFDAMRALMADFAAAARTGGDLSALASAAEKALAAAPVKEKGGWDEEKIKTILEILGENPYTFLTERISSGLPRGKRQDLTERRALVGRDLDLLVGDLAFCAPARAEEASPEAQAPAV